MRHYDRHQFRHLDDAERYRDYDYIADDSWTGPNERLAPPYERGSNGDRLRADGELRNDGGARTEELRPRGYDEPASGPRSRSEPPRRTRPSSRVAGQEAEQRDDRRGARSFMKSLAASFAHSRDTIRRRVRQLMTFSILARRKPASARAVARSDKRIEEEIRERYARNSDIDAREIEVAVRGGDVVLEGFVADRRSRYIAEDMLEDVLGVNDVMNRLHVRQRAWKRS